MSDPTGTGAAHPALTTVVVAIGAQDPTGTGAAHPALVTRPLGTQPNGT